MTGITKTTKTYSIDIETYEIFDKNCKKNNINKSSFIENCIKKSISDSLGFEKDEIYFLRENKNYSVSIVGKDDTYFELSDGSKIPQILFYQTFIKIES